MVSAYLQWILNDASRSILNMQGFASSIDIDFQIDFKEFFSWPRLAIFMFFFVSSMARFFEVIVFLIFEPLGVDFELSS